jgi:hypothetical protein
MKAKKWRTIINQPTSQTPEAELRPNLATETKATVKSATATTSGSLLQSTKATSIVRMHACRTVD